jgi:hypothetical protein
LDLSNGQRLGFIGSAIILLSLIVSIVIGIWATIVLISVAYPQVVASNGITNATANATQISQELNVAELGLENQLLLPISADIIVEIVGIIVLGMAFVALGRKYGIEKMSRYGYYGAIAIVVGLALQFTSLAVLGIVAYILGILGFVFYMLSFKELASASGIRNFRYYGYGLVVGAALQLLAPIGTVVFIIVFALIVLAFRKLRDTEPLPTPFDQGALIIKKGSGGGATARKGAKKRQG